MASLFIGGAIPRGRSTLDVPVAALAGLSVAFITFAAPADLLSELVRSSGVAAIIPAAEPPLGMNARLAIGAGGAIIVFALAFLLLRWLDRFGEGRAEAEPEADFAAPRLRRRDFHPDAPPRPPLSAAAELGEPQDDEVLELKPQPEDPVRPSWLPQASEALVDEPRPVVRETPPEPAPMHAHSLAELLDRLEQGLARRRGDVDSVPEPSVSARAAPAESPQVFPEAPDNRLQSAIDSLQRLASRHD